MRETYVNGDEVGLKECGCDGCSPAMVNGKLCHEHGCPDSWRDYSVPCRECGCNFLRSERHQRVCPDCSQVNIF